MLELIVENTTGYVHIQHGKDERQLNIRQRFDDLPFKTDEWFTINMKTNYDGHILIVSWFT